MALKPRPLGLTHTSSHLPCPRKAWGKPQAYRDRAALPKPRALCPPEREQERPGWSCWSGAGSGCWVFTISLSQIVPLWYYDLVCVLKFSGHQTYLYSYLKTTYPPKLEKSQYWVLPFRMINSCLFISETIWLLVTQYTLFSFIVIQIMEKENKGY